MRRTLISLVTLVIGIIVLAACEGNVFSLKVGDCYNGAPLNTEHTVYVRNVELVSCDEPHENEVYSVFELRDSSWRGEDYVIEQAEIFCEYRFKAFVGIEFALSTLVVDIFYPSEEFWKDDDRRVTCSVAEEFYGKVTGSAKGSRR